MDIKELRRLVLAGDVDAMLVTLDRLEAAESVLEDFGTTAQEVECWLERYRRLEREAEAMRAKLEEMEQQEPVAWMDRNGTLYNTVSHVRASDKPLYLAPGAKGE